MEPGRRRYHWIVSNVGKVKYVDILMYVKHLSAQMLIYNEPSETLLFVSPMDYIGKIFKELQRRIGDHIEDISREVNLKLMRKSPWGGNWDHKISKNKERMDL